MSYRAAIILIKDDNVALIERYRQGQHYFTFPGGHVEAGETPEQAAIRETKEELGLDITLKRLVIKMGWKKQWQYYFQAEITGGSFGSGMGEEMSHPPPEKGTYQPVWMPIVELLEQPVKPREVAEILRSIQKDGWPGEPIVIQE